MKFLHGRPHLWIDLFIEEISSPPTCQDDDIPAVAERIRMADTIDPTYYPGIRR